jgi:excisionase family DNA binding protein
MPRTTANGAKRPARRPKYASMKTAAETYDVDQATIKRWIARGLIRGYRMGERLIKVDLNEIDAKVVRDITPPGPGVYYERRAGR